jgi:hypothetical protein
MLPRLFATKVEAVVCSVTPAKLRRTLDEMELALAGFSDLIAFICEQCGEPVGLKDDG